ncbi:MAG: response regulator [Acidobacteria bacterium]|nr:response regulator [Acidobacteriota bacterium]
MKQLICDRLTGDRATVLIFRSGEEAWQELQKQAPDLLVTDIQRPNDPMDGWRMISLLAEQRIEYPVVVASAFTEHALDKDSESDKLVSAEYHKLLDCARRTIDITAVPLPFEPEEFLKLLRGKLNISSTPGFSYDVPHESKEMDSPGH